MLKNLHKKIAHYRSREPSVLTADFDNDAAMKKARSVQEQCFAELDSSDKKQGRAFPSYTCMVDFAEQSGCKSVLEIGAGLSTAVWASFAERTGAEIRTVDASFAPLKAFIRGTRHEEEVSSNVQLIEGATICCDEMVEFYSNDLPTVYGGVDVVSFLDNIDKFQSRHCSAERWQRVSDIAGRWDWTARDLLTRDSSLVLPPPLLDIYSSGSDFANEINFLKDLDSRGKGGVIDKLIADGISWDLIFFDSGELASIIEWTKLKSRITVGGYAAFHDIFFPKSIKNIIPCAALLADPDWRMVFCDDSTKQGLLIAQRLR